MAPNKLARALLGLCLVASLASASPKEKEDEALAHFKAGTAAFSRKDFRAAAASFEAAYRASPHGAVKYNAALAWDAAGEPVRAIEGFESALRDGGLSSQQQSSAKLRLSALEKSLTRVEIHAPINARLSLGDLDEVAPPLTRWMQPGDHELKVRFASGSTTSRRLSLRPGASFQLTVQEPPAPLPPPPPPSRSLRTPGFILLGGAAVASGIAVYTGVQALSARDTFNDSGHTDASARERAASLRLWTNIAWGGAIVLGSVGLGLVLSHRPDAPQVQLSPTGVWLRAAL